MYFEINLISLDHKVKMYLFIYYLLFIYLGYLVILFKLLL